MATFGAGAGGSGAPQQPPGGEGTAGGHGAGALQPPPGKPTLERTYTLMQSVQGNCILVRGAAGAKRFPRGRLQTVSQRSRAALQVSKRQEGNPVLRHVRNVRWQVRAVGCFRAPRAAVLTRTLHLSLRT